VHSNPTWAKHKGAAEIMGALKGCMHLGANKERGECKLQRENFVASSRVETFYVKDSVNAGAAFLSAPLTVLLLLGVRVNGQGVVLRVVEQQDLVLGLLDQHVQPHGQVGADHVHQPKPRYQPRPVHPHLQN